MRRDKLEASEGIEEASKENKKRQEGNKAMTRQVNYGKGGECGDGQERGKRGNEERQKRQGRQ